MEVTDNIDDQWKKRIQKPIGLYVLTFLDFIGLGVLQFFRTILEAQNSEEQIPFTIMFVTLFLCGFTAASAIWAFLGDNNGRYALLAFISLNTLWLVFNILTYIAYESSDNLLNAGLVIAVLRGLFWLIINWWYLTRKDVVAYFNQQTEI